MRTGAFSNPEVVKLLNESFVCAWINKRPKEKFKDGGLGARDVLSLHDGTAPANVTSVFAGPDGTVVHAMAGSLTIASFKTQIEFALDLGRRMYEGRELRPHAGATYFGAHNVAQGVRDALVRGVHKVLSKRLRTVRDMPLDLFDGFEDEGLQCPEVDVPKIVCGLSAFR